MAAATKPLHQLQTQHLLETVKNYRQHGYSNEVRDSAIKILEQRGISLQDIMAAGYIQNHTYERARQHIGRFTQFGSLAIACSLLYSLSGLWLMIESWLGLFLWAITLFSAFSGCFISALLARVRFYQLIGKDNAIRTRSYFIIVFAAIVTAVFVLLQGLLFVATIPGLNVAVLLAAGLYLRKQMVEELQYLR